jgi:ATP-dependent DNA helicase RecG
VEPPAELRRLLAQGMGPLLHWFPGDVTAVQLAAVLVGMANTSGGTVLIGIAPRSANILGISDIAGAQDAVFQAALLADPPLVLPVPRAQKTGTAQVLQVIVPSGLPYVYNLDGRYLWREGKQTNPLPARRLRQLLLERGVVQFEMQAPPNATLADLDPEKVAKYAERLSEVEYTRTNALLDSPRDEMDREILVRRGCLVKTLEYNGEELRPTYAALALFGRSPQRWLPGATILATRFSGVSFDDQYIKNEITGTLPDQLRQAEIFIRENLRRVVRLTGLAHQESLEFPVEAVRELLVNAVAHRDYNLQGDMLHLNIFSDRLEVQSPGGLPGPVTLENLLEARFSRNAIIVQVLSDMGFIERLGYGLDRVVRLMRQYGLPPPRFEEIAGTFRVTLYGAPQVSLELQADLPVEYNRSADNDLSLNPRQESALSFLARRRRITNREYQELCPDVHPETLRRDLVELVGRGLLIKIGDKKSTYYILKK